MRSSLVKRVLLILLAAIALGACASAKRNEGLRVKLYNYAAAIRWNEIDQAVGYVNPAVLAVKPFTAEDRARWAQVQISRYYEGPQSVDPDGSVRQTVQIELIDRATQTVRSIVDRQHWTYDEEAGVWWLESGLPAL